MKISEIEVGQTYAVRIPASVRKLAWRWPPEGDPDLIALAQAETRAPLTAPESVQRLTRHYAQATVVATGVRPGGATGVLVDVVTYRPRRAPLMPGTSGIVLEVDDDGNPICDVHEIRATLGAASVYKPWGEALLEIEMEQWEADQEQASWDDGHRYVTRTPLMLLVDHEVSDAPVRFLYHHDVACVLAEQSEPCALKQGGKGVLPMGNPCPACFPERTR